MKTSIELFQDSTLPQLFEAQVLRTPENIAVHCNGVELSYRELDDKAALLAHHLRSLEVGPEVLVGVFVERSADMLVILLGILKAGGAYIPLDPDYPHDRLEYMLSHSQAPVVITQESLLPLLPKCQSEIVCIDRDWSIITASGSANASEPIRGLKPDNLAYVIYTSGSTGKPKGVQIEHDSLVNFLASMANEPGIGPDDILLAVTTISFDISILELFLPLLVGAKVVIASRETASDGELLKSAITTNSVSIMQATPTTWRLLLAAGWVGGNKFKVMCGGEALPQDLAAQLFNSAGSVWNMYGPTETTIWSTCFKLSEQNGSVYIGMPIANTPVYLLDAKMKPVPIGVAGELYIGGRGVARGYLHDPELTGKSFLQDPFSKKTGARIYKTGDEVRFLSNGNIEYRKRLDTQVKVRGFRIELGEIETALSRHQAIQQNAVIIRDDSRGDKELVAYIVTQGSVSITANEMRDRLKDSLPEYMVPSRFVLLDKLPMTPNGKIDRKAMPDPALGTMAEEDDYAEPRTELEKRLSSLWSELLDREKVGINSNFFDLGGHSLLVTRMWASLKKELQVSLALRDVFDAPTISQLAQVIESLQGNKEEVISIPKSTGSNLPPASLAQLRFWFVDQLTSNVALYNLCSAFRLKGDLDVGLLQDSLNSIIARQGSMRTSLRWEQDKPVQHVVPSLHYELPLINLSQYDRAERQVKLLEIFEEQTQQAFDLSTGPLFKAILFKMDVSEHVLFFMPHHVIWDGWSFDIFLKELAEHYSAFKANNEPNLPDITIQYADYSEWHNKWVDSDELKNQYEYWYEKLSGDLPVLELPFDHSRPAELSFNGAQHGFSIPENIVASLNQIGHEHNATLNMVLLAAYKVLLYRLSGTEDVIVGSPIQGRAIRELQDLIGVFVNTLVLRTTIKPEFSFIDALSNVRETCLSAYDHQDVPFERLVNELVDKSTLAHNPLFQVMYVFQEISNRGSEMADIEIQQVEVFNKVSMTDLLLGVKVAGNKLTGSIDYSTDLFDADTIEAFLDHYIKLLESIVAEPELNISDLSIMDDLERSKLLLEWNATDMEYDANSCLHELIEAQVDRTPVAIAVGFEGKELSYQELDQHANQLAHHLQSLGVGPDVLVGVSLQRSEQMLVAVLGILKAGGAYVPMDPEYPKERLAYMLEHSGAPVLITQSDLLDRLPEHNSQVLCLDQEQSKIGALGTDRPVASIQPEHLAYVIYTSGSTGKPKGVQVQHGAVVNFLVSMAQQPGLTAEDVLLVVTTLSFDIAALELYLPLTVGGRVEIASSEVVSDGEQLLSKLKQAKVTVMQATPATWRLLLSAGWEGCEGFKVLIGGEALPRDLANELIDRVGGVWNMYGPTETTVWSTCEYVTDKAGPMLIGRPIRNTQLYVVDAQQQPVPIGVPGELYIGGAGVVRGYLNAPELTEERFIRDPFVKDPQARMYRTGDQVRYHRDGRLEYLTRLDSQVKIRGFRIELGEIETSLLTHPAVKQGVVTVREDRPGDVRLVVYVVAEPGQDVTMTEVRKHLRNDLPEYMIPQHVVELDELPMTPNGKIDRKALPAPFGGVVIEEETYVAPRTEMEQALAKVWQEVLGVERVGIHDNFFDLGGHSLLSMQVIAMIRDRLDKKLTPRAMLLNNLEQIAQQCGDTVSDGVQKDVTDNEKDSVAVKLLGKIKTKIRM